MEIVGYILGAFSMATKYIVPVLAIITSLESRWNYTAGLILYWMTLRYWIAIWAAQILYRTSAEFRIRADVEMLSRRARR